MGNAVGVSAGDKPDTPGGGRCLAYWRRLRTQRRAGARPGPPTGRYSFTASAKYCSYTSSALLVLVTTSSTGASG